MISEVARRYAKALFEAANESQSREQVLAELRSLGQAIAKDPEIQQFLNSPSVSAEVKGQLLTKSLEGKVTPTMLSFVALLSENKRLEACGEIVQAYELISDELHGVTRGQIRSASPLTSESAKKIEAVVSKATNKKVIFQFEDDASLMGGMVATVGGWTFDDSLKSHLGRLTDQLKRSGSSSDTH